MSQGLFPSVQPRETAQTGGALPLCREALWDFQGSVPVYAGGEPVLAEGVAAVQVWAWHALQTPRFRHVIYTWGYGSELNSLIGQPYTEALKQAEARRYVREALEPNPYITGVEDMEVDFADGTLHISCRLRTVYGETEVSAHV